MDKKLTLYQHLKELRIRILYCAIVFMICFAISYLNIKHICSFLLKPLNLSYSGNVNMIYTALEEAFLTYLKLSFMSAFLISIPFFLVQIYLYTSPALYIKEKRIFILILILSPILFIAGGLFAYYIVLPQAFRFFIGFENATMHYEGKISEYISLSMHIIIAFVISFQLPILLLLLVKLKIISIESLRKNRKYYILIIAIIAAILTPPDVISQIALIIPMIFLYETSIIMIKIFAD